MKSLAVLVTKNNGDVHQVYRSRSGKFTLSKRRSVGARFKPSRRGEIERWAARRNFKKVEFSHKRNPFVIYDTIVSDGDEKTGGVNRRLENKLNYVGKSIKRKLFIGEGKRSAHAQWVFYMAYLSGYGNKAAPCCTRHMGYKHSWASCGKNSQSNHFTGDAADTTILPSWNNIGTNSAAVRAMRRVGLGLPVSGENWHVEISNSFAGL